MKKLLTWSFLSSFSVVLTAALASVGGSPLRSLKHSAGSQMYWLLNSMFAVLIFAIGYPVLSISFAAIFLSVGFFVELEDSGLPMPIAAIGALGLVTIVGSAVIAFWIGSHPGVWMDQLLTWIRPIHSQVVELRPNLEITEEALLYQIPGFSLLGLMLAMFFSLLGERFFNQRLGIEQRGLRSESLIRFRLPDELIWFFLLSLLATFYKHELIWLKYVGVNCLMICSGAYFFQGLAVITHFFNRIKLSTPLRVLGYFVLVFQLLLLVSMIGVADLWLDFRTKKKDNRSDEKIKTENF